MFDRLQRGKPSSYLKCMYLLYSIIIPKEWVAFLLSIGHMFGHVVYHLKGTIADVEGEQVPYGKL